MSDYKVHRHQFDKSILRKDGVVNVTTYAGATLEKLSEYVLDNPPDIDPRYQIEEPTDKRKAETEYRVKKDREKRMEDYKMFFQKE